MRPAAAALLLALAACAGAPAPCPGEDAFGRHLHWRPVDDPIGFAVLLPGASGLSVFDDDGHYFRAADRLNAAGLDVLVVDYKPAWRALPDAPGDATGEKIAAVVRSAVAWLRRRAPATAALPGVLVGWSLGCAGVLRLVADGDDLAALGIRGAAMYYPANEDELRLANVVPVLILTGADDDVTPLTEIAAWVRDRAPDAAEVELEVYPRAQHGFDIESLTEPRTLRLIPLIGPTATFAYDAAAAADAARRLLRFAADVTAADVTAAGWASGSGSRARPAAADTGTPRR